MRWIRTRLVLVVALVALGVAFPAQALDQPQVVRLVDVEEQFTPLDNFDFERTPPAAGDRFAFVDGLYKWAGTKRGARVGGLRGICTFTTVDFPRSVFAYCVAQVELAGGKILISGFPRFTEGPGSFDVIVGGGTGTYQGVRGSATIRDLGGGNGNSALTLHLQP